MNKDKKLIGSLMLLLVSIFWGGTYGFQSILSEKFGTFTVLFFKVLGCIGIFLLAIITKQKFDKDSVKYGLLVGSVTLIGLFLQQLGIARTTVSKASFISGLYIVFVPIIGLFSKKKPKPKFWLAVIVASVGLYFLCLGDSFSINIGDIYVIVSAFSFAFQIIFIDKYSKKVNLFPFCATQQSLTLIVSIIMMVFVEKPVVSDFGDYIIPILFLALLSGFVANIAQNKYQADVDPTVASLIMSLESVFGTLSGWLLLNQSLTSKELLGCVLMFIGIVIAE